MARGAFSEEEGVLACSTFLQCLAPYGTFCVIASRQISPHLPVTLAFYYYVFFFLELRAGGTMAELAVVAASTRFTNCVGGQLWRQRTGKSATDSGTA